MRVGSRFPITNREMNTGSPEKKEGISYSVDQVELFRATFVGYETRSQLALLIMLISSSDSLF